MLLLRRTQLATGCLLQNLSVVVKGLDDRLACDNL